MQLPHRLTLRSSRRLATLLILLHSAALLGLTSLLLPLSAKLMAGVILAGSCIVSLRRHALGLSPTSFRELILKQDGSVEGALRNGTRFEAQVSRQSTLWPWLIVVLLEAPQLVRRRSLVVMPNTLSAADERVLRAWLRWKLT